MQLSAQMIVIQVDALASNGGWNPGTGDEAKVILFQNNVTLTKDTVIADLTPATFGGYAAKVLGAGDPTSGINPATGQWELRMREPVGGIEFTTSGTSNLPQTIYGYAIVSEDGTELFASKKFDTPITLTANQQVIDVPQPKITFSVNFAE